MKRAWIAAIALALSGGTAGVVVLARDGAPPSRKGGIEDGKVALGKTALKYSLLAQFKPLFFCDPDSFPVADVEGERRSARSWRATADHEEFMAIIDALEGIVFDAQGSEWDDIRADLSEESLMRVYREHKRLLAVRLEPVGADRFRFHMNIGTEGEGFVVTGNIARDGTVRDAVRMPQMITCPICLSGQTLINTPDGTLRVSDLRKGMHVWTIDAAGHRVAGAVVRMVRRAVATPHPMIRITLEDGRSVAASPGHPTRDGQLFASLAIGDLVDGARIAAITVESSSEPYTYDLLPSGPSGAYWADGVLIGSTLAVHLAA